MLHNRLTCHYNVDLRGSCSMKEYKTDNTRVFLGATWSFVWMLRKVGVGSGMGMGGWDKIWKGLLASVRIKGSNLHLLNLCFHLVVNVSVTHKPAASQSHLSISSATGIGWSQMQQRHSAYKWSNSEHQYEFSVFYFFFWFTGSCITWLMFSD